MEILKSVQFDTKKSSRKIAILGDMLELGVKEKEFHKDIVEQTKPNGKRGKTDPNELLTAGLSCMTLPRIIPSDIVELDALVDQVKKNIPKIVKDYAFEPEDVKFFILGKCKKHKNTKNKKQGVINGTSR